MMKIIYFIILFAFTSLASGEERVNLNICYSKTVQDEAYDCIYNISKKLKGEYDSSFRKLVIKIKNNKNNMMNYRDLNNGLLKSKKEWDKWLELECSTEADVFQKGTGFHESISDECKIKNYVSRINYYNNFELK